MALETVRLGGTSKSRRRNSGRGKGQVGDPGDGRTGAVKRSMRVGDREVRLWDRSQGPSRVDDRQEKLG